MWFAAVVFPLHIIVASNGTSEYCFQFCLVYVWFALAMKQLYRRICISYTNLYSQYAQKAVLVNEVQIAICSTISIFKAPVVMTDALCWPLWKTKSRLYYWNFQIYLTCLILMIILTKWLNRSLFYFVVIRKCSYQYKIVSFLQILTQSYRDYINSDTANFSFLESDIPRSTAYGKLMSKRIHSTKSFTAALRIDW